MSAEQTHCARCGNRIERLTRQVRPEAFINGCMYTLCSLQCRQDLLDLRYEAENAFLMAEHKAQEHCNAAVADAEGVLSARLAEIEAECRKKAGVQ